MNFIATQPENGHNGQNYGANNIYGGQYNPNWSGNWMQNGSQAQGDGGGSYESQEYVPQ